jgi:putative sugar O-methyltransferase
MNNPNWRVRQHIVDKYLKACREAIADDEKFAVFKSNPDYTAILEHASKNLGESYLKRILKNNSWLIDTEVSQQMFFENDGLGSPKKEKFSLPDGSSFECSPSTLQYIGVVSNLVDLMDSLDDKLIIEIGGGYGGQCKIIQSIFDVQGYLLMDLQEPSDLQYKYLKKSGIENFMAGTIVTVPNKDEYDLVISNYALTELSEEYQLTYVKTVCLQSKHGYITCNGPLNGEKLIKEKFESFKIEPDIEGESKTNFLITW